MFKPVSNKAQFPQMEEEILKYWAEGDVFKKSLARNAVRQFLPNARQPPVGVGGVFRTRNENGRVWKAAEKNAPFANVVARAWASNFR